MCADELDRDRLENLFEIGIDEVSWKRQHNYLTLVADHIRGQIVWGSEGNDSSTAEPVLQADRQIALARDRGDLARHGSRLRQRALASTHRRRSSRSIRIDVVALGNRALDEVRRDYWNELRRLGDRDAARRFKDARWSLLKAPQNLTGDQAATLRRLKHAGGEVWRAYTLKEALRAIFAPSLTLQDVTILIDRFISKATRSRLAPFVRLGQTIPPSPRRDPPSDPARDQPRPHRSAQQQGPPDHTPRLRVPQRRRGARARDAHLRSDHPNAPTRGTPVTRDSPTSMPGEPKMCEHPDK